MKTNLWRATKKLTEDYSFRFILRAYLYEVIKETNNFGTYYDESDVVEITYKDITVSWTWDMISAVNNKTNECIDLTSCEYSTEIITFFRNGGIN